jgi:Calcineurin-like phosphoesterase
MSEPTRILIVGDLHIAAGSRDPFDRDALLAAFLASQRPGQGPVQLIILGDLFDFVLTSPGPAPDGTEAGAIARLERIATSHPMIFEALAGFAAAGGTIHVVAGNHDIELIRPSVAERLAELLGLPKAGQPWIHPWLIYVPGVLYAEHGHQHHDVNAFATLLDPYRPDGELDFPLGTHLAALQALAPPGARLREVRLLTEHVGRALSPAERRRLVRYRAHGLDAEARRTGLDRAILAELDAITPRSPAAMAMRLGKRSLGWGGTAADASQRAAERIHSVLAARGRDVPFYAFAHTHLSSCRPIVPGRIRPLYLNAGTWSRLRPGSDPAACPYVEITLGAGRPTAELHDWSRDGATPRTMALTAAARLPGPPAAGRSETAPLPR